MLFFVSIMFLKINKCLHFDSRLTISSGVMAGRRDIPVDHPQSNGFRGEIKTKEMETGLQQ
jgi:hypothetical protein